VGEVELPALRDDATVRSWGRAAVGNHGQANITMGARMGMTQRTASTPTRRSPASALLRPGRAAPATPSRFDQPGDALRFFELPRACQRLYDTDLLIALVGRGPTTDGPCSELEVDGTGRHASRAWPLGEAGPWRTRLATWAKVLQDLDV